MNEQKLRLQKTNYALTQYVFRGTSSTQQLAEENTTDTVLFQGKHVQKYKV